jgi:hypothetical protein
VDADSKPLPLETEVADAVMIEEMNLYELDSKKWRSGSKYLNPLVFWYEKRHTYPNLYKMSLKFLAIPSTSVLSEQVFSGAGRISTKERMRLGKGTIEKLVLL